ncbi:hypothetical protein AOQ84DRAFT_178846 [Glonium stellatum]|uniref:F-box domain-containing protein n=1 Tax=Glonium stellatum TaxID=574774 RepID=A0A8E2JWH0_9PEZI|nr:hypothetical protein AOQ84DRAFT_178846 [Glonium stellatum]
MQAHSRLLSLPAELRLCIYDFVFLPTQFNEPRIPDTSNGRASRALLPLLTCHQINKEAKLIAFSRTTFHVPDIATSLRDRLQILSPQLLGAVRYLAITVDLSLEPRAYDVLDSSLRDMDLEQLSLVVRRTRSVESSEGLEDDLSYILRAYPYIAANSIRFKFHPLGLKRYICCALSKPSSMKRFSILHDGCYRSAQFAQFA